MIVKTFRHSIFDYGKRGTIVKNQTIQTIFADFALFAVTKIMHRKERKVFRIYVKYKPTFSSVVTI